MKALVLEEYHKLVYKDFPDPELAEDEVLVKEESDFFNGLPNQMEYTISAILRISSGPSWKGEGP